MAIRLALACFVLSSSGALAGCAGKSNGPPLPVADDVADGAAFTDSRSATTSGVGDAGAAPTPPEPSPRMPPADAAADAPVSGDAAAAAFAGCSGARLCEDFESYGDGKPLTPWKTSSVGGTVKVDDVHAFSGKLSAHVHVTPGGNRRVQFSRGGAPLFPAEGNAFWGRMMVWASHLPKLSNAENKNVHFDVVQSNGAPATPGEYRISGMGGVMLNYEPHDCWTWVSKQIPQDKWACWEWLFDGGTNSIDFYVDGQLQIHLTSTGQGCVDGTRSVWAAPQFSDLRLGWVNYQSMAETVDMWIDDVAIGSQRIGCAAANPAQPPR